MPGLKARFILECFEQVKKIGGPEAAKKRLLAEVGRNAKIQFLKAFSGIGDKNARNIMMAVYHRGFPRLDCNRRTHQGTIARVGLVV